MGTWKKLWATPVELDEEATEAIFDELLDAIVPSHVQIRFTKRFGNPKEKFDNRFFSDRSFFREWTTTLSHLGAEGGQMTVDVVTASGKDFHGYRLKGQTRRTIKDIVIDSHQSVGAIARTSMITIYMLVMSGTKGAIVLSSSGQHEEERD